MGGSTSNNNDGHAWVVDGDRLLIITYDHYVVQKGVTTHDEHVVTTQSYNHVNWGWDGSSNGYFLDGIFDTSQPKWLDNTQGSYHNYNTTLLFMHVTH